MPFVLFALALLGVAQTPDIDQILKRLSDESIEVREAAAKELVGLGEKAEEAVKRCAETAAPELKARCREILKQIDYARKMARVLPPFRRVTLAGKGRSVEDVAKDLAAWAGVAVDVENLADVKMEADLKNLTLFEALDFVGRTAKVEPGFGIGGRKDPETGERKGKAATLRFEEGFIDSPRAYHGHFRISVDSVRTIKKLSFRDAPSSETDVFLQLKWPPSLIPEGKARFDVESAWDSKGKKVYTGEPEFEPSIYLSPDEEPFFSVDTSFSMPSPEGGGTFSLKGTVEMRFAMEKESTRFENPRKSVGEIRNVGSFKVVLKKYSEADGQASIVLEITGRDAASLDTEAFMSGFRAVCRDGSFSSRKMARATLMDGGGTATVESTYTLGGSEIAAVVFTVIKQSHEEKFEFVLKDIPLPK